MLRTAAVTLAFRASQQAEELSDNLLTGSHLIVACRLTPCRPHVRIRSQPATPITTIFTADNADGTCKNISVAAMEAKHQSIRANRSIGRKQPKQHTP